MPEHDIQQIATELKGVYRADDLTVLSFPAFREYHAGIRGLVRPEYQANIEQTVTGMMFISSIGTTDRRPYIAVCEQAFPPEFYRDELTHEFSNYEVWKKHGEEMLKYALRFKAHTDELFEHFENRVTLFSTPEDRDQMSRGSHPVNAILANAVTYFYSMHDSVLSVPTDHVTIRKGFNDRLVARKSKKMDKYVESVPQAGITASRIWLTNNFPYLAYCTFHPQSPKVERDLDGKLEDVLKAVSYINMLSPIRRMRQLLHDIKLPVNNNQMFAALLGIERIYMMQGAERGGGGSKEYWQMMRVSAEETIRQQARRPAR